MPKLFPENQPRITPEFVKNLLKLYGLKPIDYQLAKSGIENTTIIVRTTDVNGVLRIYRQQKKSTEEIMTELDFMDFLRSRDVPTPRIIKNISGQKVSRIKAEGKTWQAILMEYVAGHHEVDFDGKVIKQLARLQARIHILGEQFAENRKAPDTFVLKETIFHQHIQKQDIKNPELRAFLDRVEKYEVGLDPDLPKGWSHFDFDPDNVLFDDKENVKAILDFDDLTYMPLVVCLGYTLWDLFVDKKDFNKLKEYLAVYETERMLTPQEKALLPAIILFRHYVVSSSDISFGRHGAATEDEMLEQEKLIGELTF